MPAQRFAVLNLLKLSHIYLNGYTIVYFILHKITTVKHQDRPIRRVLSSSINRRVRIGKTGLVDTRDQLKHWYLHLRHIMQLLKSFLDHIKTSTLRLFSPTMMNSVTLYVTDWSHSNCRRVAARVSYLSGTTCREPM